MRISVPTFGKWGQLLVWTGAIASASALGYVAIIMLAAPIAGDSVLYFGMGRGLLYGLPPWTDLFETKPPVVFWLAALSLALSDGNLVYHLILLSGVVGMIGLITSAAKDRAGAILLGCSLGLYIIFRGNGYQTEAFAALPATVALLAFQKGGRGGEILAGICGGLLLLLKEPFLAMLAFSIVMFFVHTLRDWITLLRVLVIAILTACLVLLLSQLWLGYVTAYLPEMLNGRVPSSLQYHDYGRDIFVTSSAPLLLRGLYVRKLFWEFFAVDAMRGFGITLLIIILASIVSASKSWRWAGTAFLVWCLSLWAMDQAFLTSQVISILGRLPFENDFFRWKLLKLTAGIGVAFSLASILLFKDQRLFVRTATLVAAMYMITLVAGIGNFLFTHFLFAIPFWIGLTLQFLSRKRALPLAACAFAILVGIIPAVSLARQALLDPTVTATQPLLRARTQQIDAVLAACGKDRYMLADSTLATLQGRTKHSPYQLEYGAARAEQRKFYGVWQPANMQLRAKFFRDWEDASVVVISNAPDWTFPFPSIATFFQKNFSSTPPPCAEQVLQGSARSGLRFFFRQKS